MSVPKQNSTWGKVLYEGKTYGVLHGFHLSEEISEKYDKYSGDKRCGWSSAPWATMKVNWSIEEDKLYLTRFCGEGLLVELMGREKILADWIDEMDLLVKHRRVCKTYEQNGAYLNEMEILHLSFDKGHIIDTYSKTELYKSLEMTNYFERYPAFAKLCIDNNVLLSNLECENIWSAGDQIFPIMTSFIDKMIQKGSEDDISLTIEDVKTVLEEGDLAVFASVKGRDIDGMVDSLVGSMIDEGIKAKGCLLHLTIHKEYPVDNIEKIVNSFERMLGFDKEDPLDALMSNENPFIFGTMLSDAMEEDEVFIRILTCI